MPFLLLILKEWKISLIVLLSSLLLISLIFIGNLNRSKDKIEYEFKEYKDYVEKQNLINSKKQKERELEIANKQRDTEVKYVKQIKELQTYVANANASNRSLQQQLTKAKSRISEAPIGEVRTYASTTTELLETCSARLEYYGTKAQEHREAEVRAVELYNNVVVVLSKDIVPNDITKQ